MSPWTGDASGPQFAPLSGGYPVIERLLPRNTVSLLVGAAYSGKTSLLLPACSDYLTRGEFLGYQAPVNSQGHIMQAPMGYMACDRTLGEVSRSIHESGLPALTPERFPVASWQSVINRDAEFPTIHDLYATFPEPRPQFLVVEAVQALVSSGKISDFQEVTRFYGQLKRFCAERDVTILATTLTAKIKGDESYSSQDRPLGSSAWASGAATLMVLDMADADQPEHKQTTLRKLVIRTRRQAPNILYYDWNMAGHLVPTLEALEWREALTTRLWSVKEGDPVTKATMVEWGESLGVRERAVEEWLTECVAGGSLERVKKGTYRRPYKT
jgi:hypothetical protein